MDLPILHAATVVSPAVSRIVDRYAARASLRDDGSCLAFRTGLGLDVQVFHQGRRFESAAVYRAGTSEIHAHCMTLASLAAVLYAREQVNAASQ